MAIEIQVPKLGLTMEQATLVSWSFSAGDSVKEEEIVLVLETDKVTYEMPAPGSGLLVPLAQAGATIKVAEVIGYLATDAAEAASLSDGAAPAPAAEAPEAAAQAAPATAPAQAAPSTGVPGGRVKTSPLARSMAKEHGLDINAIQGTGPGGRIVREDILAALEAGPQAAPAAAEAPAPAAPVQAKCGLLTVAEEIPVSGVRKVVYKNMHQSLQEQAQLTLYTEASATEMIELRKKLNAMAPEGTKVSYNAILIKALAQAIGLHPAVNAATDGEVIRVWKEVHVGVAMDLGDGLIVPKVRDAATKSVVQISRELSELIDQARAKTLMPDDMAAGTITLTSLGAWDIDHFTPIVNNPESAILGIGRIKDKPVAKDGQVCVEPILALSLTIDHRIIDGAPGAAFLKTVKDMIEQPLLML